MAETYAVQFEGTGQSYDCGVDDTLLRAGLRAGLGMAYECNVGSCGTCKFQLLEGVVDVKHDMREFRFRAPENASFLPGQYALLQFPGVNGVRAYSMSNVSGNADWEFIIRRVPNGAGTGVLFDRLRPGGEIEMDGPYGLAYLRPDSPRDLVCVAGGSGLSPMISIARGMVRAS